MDLENLPQLYQRVAPELFQDPSRWPEETRATCHACPMAPQPDEAAPPRRRVFARKHRCCTYVPALTNWQAGRILKLGGVGAEKLLARMDDADGVDGYGVTADLFGERTYANSGPTGFGTMELRCPYWVDGPLSCSIWHNRNAVCRNWYCKAVDGKLGQRVWDATKELMYGLERASCSWLVEIGPPPGTGLVLAKQDDEALPTLDDQVETARATYDKQMWVDWFLWCAERIERATDDEIAELREDAQVVGNMIRLRTVISNRKAPMPDIPQVSLVHWELQDDRVALMPFSVFDPVYGPPWIFKLLSKLDGLTPWRDAQAETEAEVGEKLDPDFLPTLWRAGGLSWPNPRDRDLGAGTHAHITPIPGL